MKKYFILNILLLKLLLQAKAGSGEKPSKQYSFELGYHHIVHSDFGYNNSGISTLFDYAWKLSGSEHKKNIYLSIPIGYSYLFTDNNANGFDIKTLVYGWTVRHELTKTNTMIPFIGYALLLNQLSMERTEGSIFGHNTKFETGMNIVKNKKNTM